MSIDMVYAAITHALICFDLGYSFDEALEIREKYSAVKVRELLSALCTMFDLMMELNVALG